MSIFHYCKTKPFVVAGNGCFLPKLLAILLLTACDGVSSGALDAVPQLSAPVSVDVGFVDVNTLEVNWSAVSGSIEYKVYMDDNSEALSIEYVGSVAGETSFTKGDLQASTPYWFWIKACASSSDADCSAYSDAAAGDTTPAEITPSDFSATPGAGGIILSWTAVDSYSYNVIRSIDECITTLDDLEDSTILCTELKINVNAAPGLVDSDVDAESIYYYWLEVLDNSGNKGYVSAEPVSLSEAEFTAGEVIFGKFFADGLDFAPALDEDASRLYVVSGDSLYALDTALGAEEWSAPFVADGAITAAPILDATGNIYIAASISSGNAIYKINSSGEVLWSSSGDNSVGTAGVGDALALIEGVNNNYLYFANGSGAIFRTNNLSSSSITKMHTMTGSVIGAMAIDWYGNVFLGDNSGNLVIVSTNSASTTTSIEDSLATAPALDSDQNVYFAAGGRVYSYTSSGVERWQSAVSVSSVSSSPVLAAGGNSVYQADSDTLYKFNSIDGSEIWSYGFSNNIYDTTPAVDADGNIYVGLSRDGEVEVLTADGQLLATYETGKSAGVSSPLKLGSASKLYFAAGDWLFAMQAEANASAESPWPQYKGNARNTAFVGDSLSIDIDSDYANAELDNGDLIFLEDENGRSWVSDDSNFTVGTSSMRSPTIDDSETACLRTLSNQSGFLSFFWQVSSERGYDYLNFSIIRSRTGEIAKIASITGSVDWQQEGGIAVSSGEELQWCYGKDTSASSGQDAAWLDSVQIQ